VVSGGRELGEVAFRPAFETTRSVARRRAMLSCMGDPVTLDLDGFASSSDAVAQAQPEREQHDGIAERVLRAMSGQTPTRPISTHR
jgi:hypothetical protein